MQLRILLLLVICNIGWSLHPLFSKWVLQDFNFAEAAILRYGSAALSYYIYCIFKKKETPAFALPKRKRDIPLLLLVGFGPFAFSPLLQLVGLTTSQSMDNAIVIAMEPLFTVLLAWVLLREALTALQMIAFGIALAGFLLVSGFSLSNGSPFEDMHFMGFFLMTMALWGESIYSVIGKLLGRKYEAIPIFGTGITVGVTFLLIYGLFSHSIPNLTHFSSAKSILAICWLGPIGTTLSYIIWMKLLRVTPVASVAITLFVQPVFGSLWGALFAGESFTLKQTCGAALILGGMLFQSVVEIRLSKQQPQISEN